MQGYTILVSVLAIIFSAGTAFLGVGLVGSSSLGFGMRFVCNFFFFMQLISTVWLVISLFKRERMK